MNEQDYTVNPSADRIQKELDDLNEYLASALETRDRMPAWWNADATQHLNKMVAYRDTLERKVAQATGIPWALVEVTGLELAKLYKAQYPIISVATKVQKPPVEHHTFAYLIPTWHKITDPPQARVETKQGICEMQKWGDGKGYFCSLGYAPEIDTIYWRKP